MLKRVLERCGWYMELGMLRAAHELLLARLRVERWLAASGPGKRSTRVAATACWIFPIYSQTFVHQEALALAQNGFALRFFYARRGPRADLAHSCAALWPLKRRVLLHAATGALDLARFRRRMPDRVDALVRLISAAAGLRPEELERHEHFLHAFSFARAVEAWGADYLHSYFFYEQTLFALVASELLGIPRGVSCYADHLLRDYPLKVVPLHLQTCAVVIATSRRIKAELETLHGAGLDSALVKPNTIDTASFSKPVAQDRAPGAPLRLVSVSRIDRKKGIEYLIEAVGILRDRGVAVEAHILGAADPHSPDSQEYGEALRARVAALALESAVRFEGQRTSREVRRFFEQSHVFVAPYVELPSGDKDGIPTSVLEAMAAGCPIVATDAGSISEIVDDEREGLLVPQRNALALAAAVERLARDEDFAARLGVAAAARARRDYDIATSEAAFHGKIRRAIAARTAPSADTAARP